MDDNVLDGNPPKDFNKIDLTQLQGFSFGTQWTQDKSAPSDGSGHSSERPPRAREGRSDGPGGGAPDRRDRRAFRRPNAGPESPGAGPAPADHGSQDRRDFAGRETQSGAPRDQGGYRPGGGGRPRFAGRGEASERRPAYESPYFSVTFYPEDVSFGALVKTVRASCRTIELFEIARTVLAKPERFTVSVAPRVATESSGPQENGPPAAAAGAKPAPIHISVPDGLPFETEEAAIAHGLRKHLGAFFDVAEVETESPKGNFLVINRCSITGELLGPPNYHRYNQTMQQHFASKIGRMSIEEYRTRVESVRDPAVVQQWLDKMKKVTRYTWRAPSATPSTPAAAPAGDAAAAASADQAAVPPTDPAPTAPPPLLAFDTLEEARAHLLSEAKDRLVRQVAVVRIHGRDFDNLPVGEIRRAIEGEYERQSRFPLDTANALRGRLRREHFTIFKKGAKGVSYVCAVKRKFRVPGQTFSENIGNLIAFIETHPMIKAGELVRQYLGLPAAAAPAPGGAEAPAAPALAPEQREKLLRAQADLLWLVREGYVTEFIDGSLYAAAPLVEAGRKEAETAEVDPENFPEIPAVQAASEAESESPEAQGVPLVGGDAEVQVPDAARQP
jgi:hypothetical protein